MKKILSISIVSLAVIMLLITVIYTLPKKYEVTIEAVSYQLGHKNSDIVKPVSIQINGKLSRNLKGYKKFKGTINIEDENIPISEGSKELDIKFQVNGEGYMIYSDIKDGQIKMFSFGSVFISEDCTKISISKFTEDKDLNSSQRGWNGEDGLMISGPATNRLEALEISNELMKKSLHGYILR